MALSNNMRHLAKQAATAALLLSGYSGIAAAQNTTSQPTATSSSTACASILTPSYSPPVAAEGWSAQLIATGLSNPRGMVFDSKGALLVVESRVGITRLTFNDSGGTCLSVASKETIVSDLGLNHAIELSDDGRTLYASTSESVYSWPYDPDRTTVENRRTLVHNMNPGGHPTRTLLLSRKVPGLLLISQGSAENIDPLAADRSSGLSQIRAFNLTNMTDDPQPYNYASDGLLIGWGLRNSVGVAEHPVTGGIFSVENSADEIHRRGQDIHEDNPGEELNFHGYLNDSSSFGGNYGYPNCFALWNTSDIPERGNLTVGSQFVIDDSVNEAITDETCARDYTPPRLTFRAHMAPLDIKFLPSSGSRAFISFHGSWNRDQPAGYRVSSVFFSESTGQPTEPPDSITAAVDVLYNPDLSVCPRGCLRPAGLAFDPATEERLFVSSDATGEIWVLRQTSPAPDPTSTWSASLSTDANGGRGPTSSAAAGLGSRSGFGTDGGMMGWLTTIMVAVGCVFVAMI